MTKDRVVTCFIFILIMIGGGTQVVQQKMNREVARTISNGAFDSKEQVHNVAHYLELPRSSQDDFCHYQDFIFQGSGEEENKKEEKAEEDEGRGRPGENAT